MDRSSREAFKLKWEVARGKKSESFTSVDVTPVLKHCRITVQNPATGQNLCTYALRSSNPNAIMNFP